MTHRQAGDRYRPVVTILKSDDGVPFEIKVSGEI